MNMNDMNTINPIAAQAETRNALARTATERVWVNLANFGNTLSQEHKDALGHLAGDFSAMAYGKIQGRRAYPLPPGGGKTQSIVAWIAALHELNITDVTVAVAASKVEALCSIYRDLVANGVPAEFIGLMHTYAWKAKYVQPNGKLKEDAPDKHASIAATPMDQLKRKQIVLITHNRVRGGHTQASDYMDVIISQPDGDRKKKRDLVIWDESLLSTFAETLSLSEIGYQLQEAEYTYAQHGEKIPEGIAYLAEVYGRLDAEVAIQKKIIDHNGEPGEAGKRKPISMPPVDEATLALYQIHLIEARARRRKGKRIWPDLFRLLELSQEAMRATFVAERSLRGLVSFEASVPDELTNVAILDASHSIRVLTTKDKTITDVHKFSPDLKRYDNVTLRHLDVPGGRSSLKRNHKAYLQEAVNIATTKAAPEHGVLFFNYKKGDEKIDYTQKLKDMLGDAGVDLEATVETPHDGPQLKYRFLTWGQETSLSEFSYCKCVILVGVMHRNLLELKSELIAAHRNIELDPTMKEIQKVELGELAHLIFQAMNRGHARVFYGNQAGAMDVWIMVQYGKALRDTLRPFVPGMKFIDARGVFVETGAPNAKRGNKLDQFVREELDILQKEGVRQTSIRKFWARIKARRGEVTAAPNTLVAALDSALVGSFWQKEDRSLVWMFHEKE